MNFSKLFKRDNKYDYILLFIYLCLFLAFWVLFYRQSIHCVSDYINQGRYASDLPAHIGYASGNVVSQYSLISIIFQGLMSISKSPFLIPAFLSTVVVATLFVGNKLLFMALPNCNKNKLRLFCILCTMCVSICIPLFNSGFSAGKITVGWHNSTFLLMKLLGLLCILLFFEIKKHYLEYIKPIEWISFAVLLILINSVKPNFIIAFAPAMLIVLIIDFIKSRGKSWKRNMIFGLAVVPSLLILIYQYMVLFPSVGEGGIIFSNAVLLRAIAEHPLLAIVQVLLFPLVVLIFNLKRIKKDEKYGFVLMTCGISLLQYLFIQESGDRATHANFGWGFIFFWFVLFLYSGIIMVENIKKYKTLNSREMNNLVIMIAAFSIHLFFGCFYMIGIFMGAVPW